MSVLMDAAVIGAQAIAGLFEQPDDEFVPTLFLRNGDGESTIAEISHFMADDESREIMGRVVLPRLVADMDARELVLVLPCWYEQVEPEAFDSYVGRPRESSTRMEGLMILSVTAEGIEAMFAPLTRQPDGPPTLGEFNQGSVEPGHTSYLQGALQALQARAQ